MAYVTCERPNVVSIWDDLKQRSVSDLEVESEVKAIRMRRDRIVIVLESVIKVYSFTSTPKCIHSLTTLPNPRGLCSLSPSSSNAFLAFPSPDSSGKEAGKVRMVDLIKDEESETEEPKPHDLEPKDITAHEGK